MKENKMYNDDIKIEDINFQPLTPASTETTETKEYWDFSDVQGSGDFEALKPGAYVGQIIEFDVHDNAKGGRSFKVVWKDTETKRQEWGYYMFENEDPQKVQRGKKSLNIELLSGFGLSTRQFTSLEDLLATLRQELIGKPTRLDVTWSPKDNSQLNETTVAEDCWINSRFSLIKE